MLLRAAVVGAREAPMTDTGWWVTLLGSLGSVGTILGLLLKYRTDLRAAAAALEKQRQEAAQAAEANERNLRQDLFAETRALRKELQEQADAQDREITAVRAEAAAQTRSQGLEIKTLRSNVMRSQTDIRDLNIQLFQMSTYWGEVHRIAMLLYPVEWTQILAQVRVPKPEWAPRAPDALPPATPELPEGDPNRE
jgi:hypothetical protein